MIPGYGAHRDGERRCGQRSTVGSIAPYRAPGLDFFGGMSGPLRDDLGVRIGHIGIRFDGQIVKRDDAPDEEDQRAAEY